MADYSWVIALVLGGAVVVAFGLMIYDWRHDTFKNDVANAVLGLCASTAAFFSVSLLHVRHADWMFAPIAGALAAFFSKDRKVETISLNLYLLAASIGIVAVENLVDAYHLQRFEWPIGLAGAVTFFLVCWIIGGIRKSHVKSLP